MNTNMFRFGFVLLLAGVTPPSYAQEIAYADLGQVTDTYAIYSLLLTNPTTAGLDTNERYLIAPTTVPGDPGILCVEPPKGREAEFKEVLADYDKRKNTPFPLKPLLHITERYVILTEEDVKAFSNERLVGSKNKPSDERFRGVTHLFRLGDVYFNPQRTLALVQLSTWCGSLCGRWDWRVFEKVDGKWEERHWVRCGAVS